MTGRILLGFAIAWRLALALPAAGEDSPAPPVIYKWVDENGIAHYTTDRERIPARLRDRIPRGDAAPTTPGPAPPRAEDAYAERDRDAAAPLDEPAGGPAPESSPAARGERAARIAALEAEIAAGEETLKARLGEAAPDGSAFGIADDPALRAIAERLPRLLATLRALRAEGEAPEPQ